MTESTEKTAFPFWERLRSRKVVQWGLGYIAVAWGLLQGTEFAVTTFHWPVALTRVAAVGAVAGLPITLTIAWFHGNRGEQRVRRLELALLSVLVLAAALAIYREAQQGTVTGANELASNRASMSNAHTAAAAPARSVAVLPFQGIGETKSDGVLAFGIAEAVLHQLANLRELEVIARTSSFSLQDKSGDARDVGRALNVRYLLEGSVQEAGERLRITAELIDTATGAHVWSIRFDKERGDIFAVQDEIALQVANALQLSLGADATERLAGQGTTHVSAYLAYLQGRSLLAKGSVSEAGHAIDQFTQAMQLDPAFASAYVSLAEAEIFSAEFDATDDRAARFEAALLRAEYLVAKALTLDPKFGPAYLMRGYLRAFFDLTAAEADYRRGLKLRPSDAKGYAGLASVLFEQRAQRAEALQMLEHARRLDPLEPAHDVTKAVFLLLDRSDLRGTEALLRSVLQRNPEYLPATTWLGELNWCCMGNMSEAAKYLERSIKLDPSARLARRLLTRVYLDVGDEHAAEAVMRGASSITSLEELPLRVYQKKWLLAGELAYAAFENNLAAGKDEFIMVLAMRRHARLTRDYQPAIDATETWSGVTWTDAGEPLMPERPFTRTTAVALADLLLASGERQRAESLLQAIITQLDGEVRSGISSELWTVKSLATALALSGDEVRALDLLERGMATGALRNAGIELLENDPAFDAMREHPRFAAVLKKLRAYMAIERAEIKKMRAAGELPSR